MNVQPIFQSPLAPAPSPASAPAPAAPSAPCDSVTLGSAGAPSKLYRFGRGAAATVGGVTGAVVGGGLGGVKHAGDQSIHVPGTVVRAAAIGGAALGLVRGIVTGASGGPLGLAIGIITGPALGAFVGGGAVLGGAVAIDAVKGSITGAKGGFHVGYDYVGDVVDRIAGRGESAGSSCDCGAACECGASVPAPAEPAPAPEVSQAPGAASSAS